MCELCCLISLCMRKEYKESKGKKINIKETANISTWLELQYITVCVCLCHHKTIRSVGWVLLMQVNIASRAAILIMSNIIHSRWLWTAGQANEASSSFLCKMLFLSHILSRQPSTIDTSGKMLMLIFVSFHSKGRMGGRGRSMKH